MDINVPDGYSLDRGKKVGKKDYIFLYKKGVEILMLPTEHCPSQKIMEVIQQTKGQLLNFENLKTESNLKRLSLFLNKLEILLDIVPMGSPQKNRQEGGFLVE